jgi:manganese efflux pump family protein
MSFVGLCLIALSLATDCFAAAIGKGTALRRPPPRDVLVIGLLFGAFAAAMPAIGWAIGVSFRQFVTEIDHWIALALLGAIGGHMIWEALHADPEKADNAERRIIGWALVGTAFATSIDAAAVGITFAFLDVNILQAALVIGIVCGAVAVIGLYLARITGPLFGRKAEILGGIVLIAIGVKIAVEHTLEQGFLF